MLDELVDFVVTALSLALDLFCVSSHQVKYDASTHTSIRCIGDEASDTDALGLLLREGAEVDALHLAFDLVLNLCLDQFCH